MKAIDSELVAQKIVVCGKRLKIAEVVGLLAEAMSTLNAKNPIVKEVIEKCGDDLSNAFEHTLITFFSLYLLARTHDTKEYKKIIEACEVDKETQA